MVNSFMHLLRRHVETRGDRQAIAFLDEEGDGFEAWTYRELDRHARAMSVSLSAQLKQGSCALILCPPGLQFVKAILGCFYAGIVAVPVYPPANAQQTSRIATILQDTGSDLILTTRAFKSRIESWLSALGEVRHYRFLLVDEILVSAEADWETPVYGDAELAFLQYTSGSTSEPKGVMVSHGNLMANLEMIRARFELTADSIIVGWLPMFHDMGLVGNLLEVLYVGGQTVLMSPVSFVRKPVRWLEAATRFQATVIGGPNFGYALCADRITPTQKAGLDLSALRIAYCGSEPIDYRVLERFSDSFKEIGFDRNAFYPCYGMAEATLLVTGSQVGAGAVYFQLVADDLADGLALSAEDGKMVQRVLVGCGVSVIGQDLRIVAPKTRRPLADGQIGEVWISGPHVALGYWLKPVLTEEAFCAYLDDSGEGPYLRTGDLGFLRDAHLVIAGRIKELIIVRGRNHYPQDIERTVAQSHPSLQPQSGSAFSVEVDGEAGIVVVQEVRRTALRSLPAEEVACLVRQRVLEAHELALHALVLIKPATLPRTSSGKIMRGSCRSAYVQGELESVYVWTALSEPSAALAQMGLPAESIEDGNAPLETRIRQWVANRAGLVVQEVSPDKPFADFGLDSVAALELAECLEKWLGRPVPATVFWDFPTIAALSAHLSTECHAVETLAAAMVTQSPQSKEPALAGGELEALSERELAALLAEELGHAD